MTVATLNQLKLELLHSYVQHCEALVAKATEEQTDIGVVMQDLAWLSSRCKTLCASEDARFLTTIIRNDRYWDRSEPFGI